MMLASLNITWSLLRYCSCCLISFCITTCYTLHLSVRVSLNTDVLQRNCWLEMVLPLLSLWSIWMYFDKYSTLLLVGNIWKVFLWWWQRLQYKRMRIPLEIAIACQSNPIILLSSVTRSTVFMNNPYQIIEPWEIVTGVLN